MAPELLQGGQGDAGIGLASMRERVRQLGGRFQISGMGGTIIQVALPLHGYEEMAS
jgi:signal transduction histidine kinase